MRGAIHDLVGLQQLGPSAVHNSFRGHTRLRLFKRHAKSAVHRKVLSLRCEKKDEADKTHVVSSTLGSFDQGFVLPRVLVETRGSFRDFGAWATNVSAVAVVANASAGSAVPTARTRTLNRADAKASVATMASVERDVTHAFLAAATAFALAADGLGRTYQVNITMVIWKFPTHLQYLLQPGLPLPWLQTLGPRGPWLVDRMIGARELPAALNTDAKAAEVRECVRRAVFHVPGDNNAEMFQRICASALCWASDGADSGVGRMAVRDFRNMVFREWEESHSAVKLLPHA